MKLKICLRTLASLPLLFALAACQSAVTPAEQIVVEIPTLAAPTVVQQVERVINVDLTSITTAQPTVTSVPTFTTIPTESATPTAQATQVPPTLAATNTPVLGSEAQTPIAAATVPVVPTRAASGAPQGWIAYVCYDGLDDEICVINSDGSGQRQLTINDVEDYYPSFSNSGEWIAFARQEVDGSSDFFELYRVSIDGSKVIPLTNNGSKNASPAYSNDDSQIVYTSKLGDWQHQIWLMEANGNNPVKLTSEGNNFDPAWSFDGEWISFASDRTGARQLWVMRPDGSEQRQITNVEKLGGRNDWSLDDRYLFFYAGVRNVDRQIYSVEIETGDVTPLTDDGANAGPGTSRYGEWVAWQTGGDIWLARQDGSDPFNLTKSTTFDYQPRWGP